jgi:hypothetical protein
MFQTRSIAVSTVSSGGSSSKMREVSIATMMMTTTIASHCMADAELREAESLGGEERVLGHWQWSLLATVEAWALLCGWLDTD